jgi:hypothetical protein
LDTADEIERSVKRLVILRIRRDMQPKMNHFAWTKEETILQVHGVGPWAVNYVDPADDPRKK